MRYAQINSGNKLHLVFEPGEGWSRSELIPAGQLSAPICNTSAFQGHYRMNINVPMRRACKNCIRVAKSHGLR